MEQLIQQVAAGLANGAIYASLALALVMIFVSTDHINFAQGERRCSAPISPGNSCSSG
jgi:branched-chain amino acid transport system permease protein